MTTPTRCEHDAPVWACRICCSRPCCEAFTSAPNPDHLDRACVRNNTRRYQARKAGRLL